MNISYVSIKLDNINSDEVWENDRRICLGLSISIRQTEKY